MIHGHGMHLQDAKESTLSANQVLSKSTAFAEAMQRWSVRVLPNTRQAICLF